MRATCSLRRALSIGAALLMTGCYSLPLRSDYRGPPERPLAINEYYAREEFSESYSDTILRSTDDFDMHRYVISTAQGQVTVDHFARKERSDSLIFVFPVLGGKKNIIENYFAEFFAKAGFDTAIVHRNDDFKKPENFDRLEEMMRASVIRDRVAIDFFEDHLGKKRFGTFGLSRGAINVAITAGVDERLKHNVMLLGGSDLVQVFRHTDQPRIRSFVKVMRERKRMSEEEFFDYLNQRIRTDPKYLSRYMDGRTSLLFLSLFDNTVPIETGFRLRNELGGPETIVIMAGHYSSLLYTGIANSFLPKSVPDLMPIEYVETESVRFFRKAFHPVSGHTPLKLLPMRLLRLPFDMLGRLAHFLFEDEYETAPFTEWNPWRTPLVKASADNMCTYDS